MGTVATKMAGSTKGLRVGRKRKEPETATYSGRLAARLRTLRERAGKTPDEMATALDVPTSTYYAYEAHTLNFPTDLIPAFAETVGIKPRAVYPEN